MDEGPKLSRNPDGIAMEATVVEQANRSAMFFACSLQTAIIVCLTVAARPDSR
jgi:hypothetical protein